MIARRGSATEDVVYDEHYVINIDVAGAVRITHCQWIRCWTTTEDVVDEVYYSISHNIFRLGAEKLDFCKLVCHSLVRRGDC